MNRAIELMSQSGYVPTFYRDRFLRAPVCQAALRQGLNDTNVHGSELASSEAQRHLQFAGIIGTPTMGESPGIAINDDHEVVVVYRSTTSHQLLYRLAKIDGSTMFLGPVTPYDTGSNPSVSINDFGNVVEVHKSENHDTLWVRYGQLASGMISFGPSQKFDTGTNPSVTCNRTFVLSTHENEKHKKLFYNNGG